jgi:hypothetical protein
LLTTMFFRPRRRRRHGAGATN